MSLCMCVRLCVCARAIFMIDNNDSSFKKGHWTLSLWREMVRNALRMIFIVRIVVVCIPPTEIWVSGQQTYSTPLYGLFLF